MDEFITNPTEAEIAVAKIIEDAGKSCITTEGDSMMGSLGTSISYLDGKKRYNYSIKELEG